MISRKRRGDKKRMGRTIVTPHSRWIQLEIEVDENAKTNLLKVESKQIEMASLGKALAAKFRCI